VENIATEIHFNFFLKTIQVVQHLYFTKQKNTYYQKNVSLPVKIQNCNPSLENTIGIPSPKFLAKLSEYLRIRKITWTLICVLQFHSQFRDKTMC